MTWIQLDVECYVDYFLLGFLNPETGRVIQFEKYDDLEFDSTAVMKILRKRLTCGFNSNNYDLPMIFLACYGLSCADLKRASNEIIDGKQKPWHMEKLYDVRFPKINHVDLFDVAPGQASLKIYGGRVHSKRMQDLPYPPEASISPEQRPIIRTYNANDLWTTEDLRLKLVEQIALREVLTEQYGMDLRSKSDPQIAEAVIRSQIAKRTGTKPERPLISRTTEFTYDCPQFIKFKTKKMQDLLADVCKSKFSLSDGGKPVMPPQLEGRVVRIGKSAYRMGMGGLHSSEKHRAHFADEDHILIDRDVRSYYPMIILMCRLFPKHLGTIFLKIFGEIVKQRLKAKDAGNDVIAQVMKIIINGTFGKLGSSFSCLYSPNLLIQVTLTGQLALLMLIESIHLAGIRVVSANTDGVMIKCRRDSEDLLAEVVKAWEDATGLETEEVRYSSVFSRDVNDYVAMYETPKVKKGRSIPAKAIGVFAEPGLSKNPTCQICVSAVIEYLVDGADIEGTIRECQDIRKFVAVRKVDKGGAKDGEFLGKAVRWYYSTSTSTGIHSVKSGNLVARTEGAMPLMELPDAFPDDLDYDWYIRESRELLLDMGVGKRVPTLGPRIRKQIDALV